MANYQRAYDNKVITSGFLDRLLGAVQHIFPSYGCMRTSLLLSCYLRVKQKRLTQCHHHRDPLAEVITNISAESKA